MKLKIALLAGLAAIVFSGNVAARHAPLVNPAPITVPANLSDKEISKEIRRALLQRGWEVDSETPGVIDSTLHLREHVAKIKVTYGNGQVKLAYVDSTNLEYKKDRNGTEEIHPNYLNWMQFLSNDIKANLSVASLNHEG
ncbi:MAG: hypothetical protein JSR63_06370 [Proteobacteria bacterium]|nr:hypothetical protein [Pseudomonadota bacterium]MBS0217792.1 hypothetical protein [Pseudomonadota bacterium]